MDQAITDSHRQAVALHKHQCKRNQWTKAQHAVGEHVTVEIGGVMVEAEIVDAPRTCAPFIYGVRLIEDGVRLWASERELFS